ncbi:PIN domain-containing protein [Chytridium lagenaria]|nr:PIN domain-containing protein [Chytridium lagenaria]
MKYRMLWVYRFRRVFRGGWRDVGDGEFGFLLGEKKVVQSVEMGGSGTLEVVSLKTGSMVSMGSQAGKRVSMQLRGVRKSWKDGGGLTTSLTLIPEGARIERDPLPTHKGQAEVEAVKSAYTNPGCFHRVCHRPVLQTSLKDDFFAPPLMKTMVRNGIISSNQQQLNHTPYPSQAYTHHEYHDPSLYQQQQWAYNHQQVLEEESADYMDLDDELFQEELRRELQELRQESGNTLNVEWEEKRKEGGAYDPAVTAMEIINHAEQQDTVFDAVIVVDTNYLISHLRFISQLSQVLDASMPLMLMYMFLVVYRYRPLSFGELDGLKSRRKPADNAPAETLGEQARKAIDFLYRSLLSKKPSIRGQRLEDRLPDLDVLKMSNDDRILECCRFSKKFQAIRVYLLSNDKNLCVNAMFHGIDHYLQL